MFELPIFELELSEEQLLRRSIANARMERDELIAAVASKRQRAVELKKEYDAVKHEAEIKMQMLSAERLLLVEEISPIDAQIKALNTELANLERELALYLERQLSNARNKAAITEFDELAEGLRWAEIAMPHQWDAARVIALNKRVILADDMGMGKTLETLMALDMMAARRVLIIAPSDVIDNFQSEIEQWAPHRGCIPLYRKTQGERTAILQLLKVTEANLCIMLNYEAWRKDETLVKKLIELRFDTVILDEAHNIKDANGTAFTGVQSIVLAQNCCANCSGSCIYGIDKYLHCECGWTNKEWVGEFGDQCSVKNVIPVTGTTILNRPQELFPLLRLILPQVFVKQREFLDMYCTQDPYTGYWSFVKGGLNRMKSHLQGRYISRTAESVGLHIPKCTLVERVLDITEDKYPLQLKYMKMLSKHSQIILSDGAKLDALAAITLILRKRQMNVWPGGIELKDKDGFVTFSVGADVQESIKVDYAEQKIKEWYKEGRRSVSFSQFKPPLHELARRLNDAGIRTAIFDGGTSDNLRSELKQDFNRRTASPSEYKYDVLLCNYRTGGVGLNFTSATRMMILDEEWNPGKNRQAHARIHRIGQTEETEIWIPRVAGTIDTWMAELNRFKQELVEGMDMAGKELTEGILDAIRQGDI